MATHSELSKHLDLSTRAIADLLPKLGLPSRDVNLEKARIAYIRHLRRVAAGHQSITGLDLTQERAKLAAIQRVKASLEVGKMKEQLVSAAEVKVSAFNMARTIRISWENWANQTAGPLASELGTEINTTRTVLEKFVRKHLIQLSQGEAYE
jgi:hypothetical protein